jgi:hypothetical protein
MDHTPIRLPKKYGAGIFKLRKIYAHIKAIDKVHIILYRSENNVLPENCIYSSLWGFGVGI